MGRIGIGLLAVIVIILVIALCFDAFDDEQEIEIEEGRVPAVETMPAASPDGIPVDLRMPRA